MLLRLRYLTLFIDYFLLVCAFCMAYFVRVGFIWSTDLPFEAYFATAVIAAALWIGALLVFRGYNPAVRFTRWIHMIKVIVAGVTGTAVFGLVFYFAQKSLFSRLLLTYIFLFGTGIMILFHLFMQFLEKQLITMGHGTTRLLIIGSNRGVKSFIKTLQDNTSPYVPVAILDGYGTKQKEIHGVPVLGKLNILEKTVEEEEIDAIVQGDNIEQVLNIHNFCQQQHLDYYLLPYLLGAYQGDLQVSILEKPVINPMRSKRSLWQKLLS